MRVKPTPVISIALLLMYIALVAAIWAINGVDYDAVSDSSATVIKGIVIPVGVGAVFLAVAATWLGWWRPALVETSKVGPRWGLLVPALLLVIALSGVVSIDFGAASAATLLLLALGTGWSASPRSSSLGV